MCRWIQLINCAIFFIVMWKILQSMFRMTIFSETGFCLFWPIYIVCCADALQGIWLSLYLLSFPEWNVFRHFSYIFVSLLQPILIEIWHKINGIGAENDTKTSTEWRKICQNQWTSQVKRIWLDLGLFNWENNRVFPNVIWHVNCSLQGTTWIRMLLPA